MRVRAWLVGALLVGCAQTATPTPTEPPAPAPLHCGGLEWRRGIHAEQTSEFVVALAPATDGFVAIGEFSHVLTLEGAAA